MQKFILDPSLIERMGLESRKMAVKKFSTTVVNRTIGQTIGIL